ncbi:hypothetical protein CYMTET_21021 [Cymbomonas tetramitiformis]|uniref:Uncharacterized protein n=1 Tax=Cymbomonas tetramitiformis TaxID=36881 RepID=A0AAE0L3K0_9CHLO|nr:hypothetical protein CYMTET_21021 [Cymbomonas tetramitiformis]
MAPIVTPNRVSTVSSLLLKHHWSLAKFMGGTGFFAGYLYTTTYGTNPYNDALRVQPEEATQLDNFRGFALQTGDAKYSFGLRSTKFPGSQ